MKKNRTKKFNKILEKLSKKLSKKIINDRRNNISAKRGINSSGLIR
jgi:tRNA splicing ligase